jgi:exoribonuclease R
MELNVCDRNYIKWFYTNKEPQLSTNTSQVNPLEYKLFHKDVINTDGSIVNSPYRQHNYIPGILVIDGNTYGRTNDNKTKLLYKCIPYDKSLPIILIGYENRYGNLSKNKKNKYITFKIKDWYGKHPIGILTNTISNVEDCDGFYQYQLCCKGLNISLTTFTNAAHLSLNHISREKLVEELISNLKLEDRRNYDVFTIDPIGCKDFDDAISVSLLEGNNYIISIYIANVAIILDYLHLWDKYSDRVSTIYLPNGKIPMLPTILSDDLCSLQQQMDRVAYCMDIAVNDDTGATIINFKPVIINVKNNYIYEEHKLLLNSSYRFILNATKRLTANYRYVESITDSHDIIEFYMIFMNFESSKILKSENIGIFRTAQLTTSININTLPKEFRQFAKSFNSTNANYCTANNVQSHDLIGEGLSSYVHVTSPIRRLVDLINLIDIQNVFMSENARLFSEKWKNKLDYININMKSIKKVQNSCNLLSIYNKSICNSNKSICNSPIYNGLLFNKTKKNETMFKYSVYIPDLKMVSNVKTTKNLEDYTLHLVSTHLFMGEDNIVNKIRLQLV